MKSLARWLGGLMMLLLPTLAIAQSFNGRTSAYGTYSVAVNVPSTVQNGDLLIAEAMGFGGSPAAVDSGWTYVGGTNIYGYYQNIYSRVWSTGNQTSFSFNDSNYMGAVIRDYTGSPGIDQFGCNANSPSTPQLTIGSNETFVAFYVNNSSAVTLPTDLGDEPSGDPGWANWWIGDGDKSVAAGTVPSDTASASGGTFNSCGLTLLGAPTATPTEPTSAGGITFIGRTENSTSSANTNVTVSAPAVIQPGDTFVITVSGYQSYPSNTPSGLTFLGSVQDVRQYGPDYLSAYEGVYSAGGPASFTFSGVNYPKAILRAYRGVQAVDAKAFSSTNASARSLSLPALPGTSAANDWYVGFYTTDTQLPVCPSDLGDGSTDGSLWQSCDGDKVISNQGTSPGPETASSASNTDWIGFDIDLISLPLGTSTPTPAATTAATPMPPVADTDSSFIFSRTTVPSTGWITVTNSAYFDGSALASNGCINPPQTGTSVQGPMAVINFTGTGITLIGQTGPNFGIGAYALDGGSLTPVDAYSSSNEYQQPLLALSGLTNESHALSYQVTCNKNASSSDFYQVVNAYQVTGAGNPFSNATQYSYAAGNVTLNGSGWTCGEPENPSTTTDLSGDHCWDGNAGDSVSWTFTGSLIEVYIRPDTGDGYFDVQIDGNTVAHDVSGQYTYVDNDQLDSWMGFAASGLSSGSHTMKLIIDGSAPYPNESENSGQKNLLQFDVGLAFP